LTTARHATCAAVAALVAVATARARVAVIANHAALARSATPTAIAPMRHIAYAATRAVTTPRLFSAHPAIACKAGTSVTLAMTASALTTSNRTCHVVTPTAPAAADSALAMLTIAGPASRAAVD